jgi:hypothetical protein
MKFPFEAKYEEIPADTDQFVTAALSSLASEFLIMPNSDGFVSYPLFEEAYGETRP